MVLYIEREVLIDLQERPKSFLRLMVLVVAVAVLVSVVGLGIAVGALYERIQKHPELKSQ